MKPHTDVPYAAWSCDEKTDVKIAGVAVTGYKAQQAAAMICFGCPAQYDCVRFALMPPGEDHGVWGLQIRDLRFLRRVTERGLDPVRLVDAAESEEIPVQVMVRRLRG